MTDQKATRDAIISLIASLIGAVSLLKRGSKKAAASDKIFDQMIQDYQRAIDQGIEALGIIDNEQS